MMVIFGPTASSSAGCKRIHSWHKHGGSSGMELRDATLAFRWMCNRGPGRSLDRTMSTRSILLIRAAIAATLLPAVSGCASFGIAYGGEAAYNAAFREKITDVSELSPDERSRLRDVKIFESARPPEGTSKGEVFGLACKLTVALLVFKWVWRPELNESNGPTPEDAARTQLRIKAMQIEANVVAAPSCTHKDGIDWANNCFESWRCLGEAFVIP